MTGRFSTVSTKAIGKRTIIHPYCVIAESVIIGDDVIIHPHVVIEDGVSIGNRVEIFPGAYIGKEPKGAGALSRQPNFNKVVEIDDDVSIGPNVVIYCDVRIGKSSLIGDSASIREQSSIGDKSVIGRHVTVNYNTVIGSHVKIMDHSWLAGNMIVEDSVFISGGVLTTNDNSMGRSDYDEENIVGPYIMKSASIGAGAILLPNITIGKGSIVAAGSVVTRNVPDNTLVVGSPARHKLLLEVKDQ